MSELIPLIGTLIAGFLSLIITQQRNKAKQVENDSIREKHFNDFVAQMRADHKELKRKFAESEAANKELLSELDLLAQALSSERNQRELMAATHKEAEAQHKLAVEQLESKVTELKHGSENLTNALQRSVAAQDKLRERIMQLETRVSELTAERTKLLEELKTAREKSAETERELNKVIGELTLSNKVLSAQNQTYEKTVAILEKIQGVHESSPPEPKPDLVEQGLSTQQKHDKIALVNTPKDNDL